MVEAGACIPKRFRALAFSFVSIYYCNTYYVVKYYFSDA